MLPRVVLPVSEPRLETGKGRRFLKKKGKIVEKGVVVVPTHASLSFSSDVSNSFFPV